MQAPPGVPIPYPLVVPDPGKQTPFTVARSQKTARLPSREIPFHAAPCRTAHSTGPERKVPPYAYSLATHCKLDPTTPYPYGPYVAAFPYGPYGYGGYAYNHQAYLKPPPPEGLATGGMVSGRLAACEAMQAAHMAGHMSTPLSTACEAVQAAHMAAHTAAATEELGAGQDCSTPPLALPKGAGRFFSPSPSKSTAAPSAAQQRWKESWGEYEDVCSVAHTSPHVGPYLADQPKCYRSCKY